MWKLPLQQKVIKNVEIKILQQEVQALCEQEKYKEAAVEALQSEVEQLTGIQLVQQKIQSIVQSIVEESLEHAHSDHVEQLAAQAEEVVAEVAKVETMVQEFQDKVHTAVQPESAPGASSCA